MTVVQKQKLVETGGSLREASGDGGARRRITIIEAGWGSSGYYSEAVLRRDGPKVFGPGTHMYLNHPSATEETDRPERDLHDLVGTIETKPSMDGKALVAEAEVYEHWVPVIDAMAKDIGVSIRAVGAYEFGEAEGREGPIITSLDKGLSVDYVTMAGAGGKVGALIESARQVDLEEARNAGQWFEARIHRDFTMTADDLFGNGFMTREERIALSGAIGDALDAFTESLKQGAPGLYDRDPYADPEGGVGVSERKAVQETAKTSNEEDGMSDESKQALADLQETVDELRKKVGDLESELSEAKAGKERAEDALLQVRAKEVVAEATIKDGDDEVSIYQGLPERAIARVKEAALRDVPVDSDGKLDEGKLQEKARDAAKDEREYLREAGATSTGGKVTGFGESRRPEDAPKGEGEGKLQEGFQRLGLGEDAAKIAAGGR